ncbi:MAG: hypothetical protein VX899_22100 [Myxococcota bacterium]|nr:hypothetical protein [Myxococcota bacterium]
MDVITSLHKLPDSGLTVTALRTLDKVVPGEWHNHNNFPKLVMDVAQVDKPKVVMAIAKRAQAMQLADPRYGQALQVYTLVDTVDQVAAGAAVASKVGDLLGNFGGGFLKQMTPKPATTQSIDAALKLVAELVAFGLLNGRPTAGPEGLAKFAGAIQDYGTHDTMRLAAWVSFDGLLPLGPDFIRIILNNVSDLASDKLLSNPVFSKLGERLPGDNVGQKKDFILKTLDTTGEWVGRFVEEKQLTQAGVLQQVKGIVNVADGAGDYIAAALDASTAYTAHTGTQTVARTLAKHALEDTRQRAWQEWVEAQ